ncbi:hypothetical protein [Methanosarcina barkeri]|nr:hypothetical protein [Methanosarcina barkeri]
MKNRKFGEQEARRNDAETRPGGTRSGIFASDSSSINLSRAIQL